MGRIGTLWPLARFIAFDGKVFRALFGEPRIEMLDGAGYVRVGFIAVPINGPSATPPVRNGQGVPEEALSVCSKCGYIGRD